MPPVQDKLGKILCIKVFSDVIHFPGKFYHNGRFHFDRPGRDGLVRTHVKVRDTRGRILLNCTCMSSEGKHHLVFEFYYTVLGYLPRQAHHLQ